MKTLSKQHKKEKSNKKELTFAEVVATAPATEQEEGGEDHKIKKRSKAGAAQALTRAGVLPSPKQQGSQFFGFDIESLWRKIKQSYRATFEYTRFRGGAIRAYRPPQRERAGCVSWNCFTPETQILEPGKEGLFPLGFRLHFNKSDMYAKLETKSNIACLHGLEMVGSGLIDNDFTHPVAVTIRNTSINQWKINKGAVICVLRLFPFHDIALEPHSQLEAADWALYGPIEQLEEEKSCSTPASTIKTC